MQCRKVAEATAIGTSRAGGVCIVLGRSSRAARDAGSERHGRANPCTPSMGVASCRVTAHTTACMQWQTMQKTEHTIFCGNLNGTPLQLQSTACLTWSFLHVEFIVRSAERRSRCRRGTAQSHVAWLYTRTKDSGPVCCIRKLSSAEPCRDGTLGVAAWTQHGPEGLCAACNDHPAQRLSAVSENATRDAL